MRQRIAILFLATLVAAAFDAGASQEGVDARAKKAFRSGVTSFNDEDYAKAADRFRLAYELKPSWKLLFNIGQCQAALKNYGRALEAFEDYLAEGGDAVPEERQREVLAEIQRLREMVGYLEVTGQSGDVLVVDGERRGVLPLGANLRLAVGEVRVQVGRDGKTVFERVVEIQGKQTTAIAVETGGEESADAEAMKPEPSEDSEPKTRRIVAWVSFGVAGAAAVSAGITGGLALKNRSDVDSHCEQGVCPLDYRDEEDRAFALAVTTDVLMGVAAAGAVVGVIMFLRKDDEADTVSTRLIPVVGDRSAGLALSGRF